MTLKTPEDVLDFWFSDQMRPYWFAKSDEIDREIMARFADTHEAARAGGLDHWAETPEGALALVIALDQFPRNIYRGGPRSFDADAVALRHAKAALASGHDSALPAEQRQFLYLPFMHSEDLADQTRAVTLYEALGHDEGLRFAREHSDIVARFGRFPHRNAILGRDSTPDEAEFLKTHSGF